MTPGQALLTILVGGVCSAALISCASAPPIPLQGSPAALVDLAGEWDGTYTSQCEAITTFRGRLRGDRLEGTFSTRLGLTSQANRRWVAYRRRVA